MIVFVKRDLIREHPFFPIPDTMTACWDVINTEWDPDQETVNFGTRQCVVVDSALYDVVTLATVECSNPVSFITFVCYCVCLQHSIFLQGSKSEPKVCGSLWEQYMVLAVDNYCHILTDNCQVVLKSFSLDSCLSSFSWSSDGKFLFLVTEGGFLSVVYIPDSLLVATMPLPGFNSQNQPIHISVVNDEILVLSSNGTLFRYHLDRFL